MRDLLTKDFAWKLLSLALAIAIWLVVRPIQNEATTVANPLNFQPEQTFSNLPVLIVSAAADVREFKVHPSAVAVTVSARPEILSELSDKELRVQVDLSGIEAARDLRKRVEVSTPPGVTFVRVSPADVDVVVPPKK
jgi:YbbR domain-containing protein